MEQAECKETAGSLSGLDALDASSSRISFATPFTSTDNSDISGHGGWFNDSYGTSVELLF